MAKIFNITGLCIPEKHYMVNIESRLTEIKKFVDEGMYFTINKTRQYGKTTTLRALQDHLQTEYYVISMDFQTFGSAEFEHENCFALSFADDFLHLLDENNLSVNMAEVFSHMKTCIESESTTYRLRKLFKDLNEICQRADKPIVLMIDEIDSAANHQVFLDFLAQLRAAYLGRNRQAALHSIILAGVCDVKNLKRKLRPEDAHKINSPWNIAADFNVDMSLSKEGIAGMLKEYEADHNTGMDIEKITGLIYDYTSGYPYLVSRLCKRMDEAMESETAWTKEGVLEAVRLLLMEPNTLFESMIGKLTEYEELGKMLGELLFSGKTITYHPMNPAIGLALMFGFVKNQEGKVIPANRIFDTLLYNHFLSLDEMRTSDIYKASLYEKEGFIKDGHLDMYCILEKFVRHFHEFYGNCREAFLEEEGRRYFLLYLRPIINGTGNYYVEARTRSLGRTDIMVNYGGEQFVIETKIWRGNEYHLRGEQQLLHYLEDYGLDMGYMLSFNFNRNKQIGVHEIRIDGRKLIEAVV